jgi:protein subunit release factor B
MITDRKWKMLRERMETLGILEEDLEEKFVRSSGRGGQHVNKTSTCVMLHHRPSDLQVKCQMMRSQWENRYLARRILCEKLEDNLLGEKSERARKRHKIRAQKRKRSKRAKEKMLRDKKIRSERKKLRMDPDS